MHNTQQQYLILDQNNYEHSIHNSYHQTHQQLNLSKNNSKHNTHSKHNQQLQDLLQSDTINYTSQKKKLYFNDISFFSKDNTQDYTNQQSYNQLLNKIHFQRSRNTQLINQLTNLKSNIIHIYLSQIMQQFNQLSNQNKTLRQIYKKQAGGGYKIQKSSSIIRNNSAKLQQIKKNTQSASQNNLMSYNHTPRNSTSRLGSRKSITALSVTGTQQYPTGYQHIGINGNNKKNSNNKVFFGVGGNNFYQTQKLDTLRPKIDSKSIHNNRMHNCQSSINMHTTASNNINTLQSDTITIQPSPRIHHKRRQSQLTQRKDYPLNNKNYNDQFLMMCDQGQTSFYCQQDYHNDQCTNINNQRYSLQQYPKMMMKNKQKITKNQQQQCIHMKNNSNLYNQNNNTQRLLNQSVQRASYKLSLNNQASSINQQYPIPTSSKNIFIQFLQTLLIQQHLTSQTLTQNIHQTTVQQQHNILIPSYQNIKYIQQLQKQITTKNIKLRQLQQVINVFKSQIQQIIGTDVKIVNQLMLQLLQVKGKYLQMQQKINNISLLKKQFNEKQKVKENILSKVRKQQQKQLQNANNTQSTNISFTIPQSIQTLFQLLNITIPINSKPIEYLTQIKKLPQNKELFQVFDSKKISQCNMKIKQVIDQIKQGRKKFNQLIKIYQTRIIKLQQKIHKFKIDLKNQK